MFSLCFIGSLRVLWLHPAVQRHVSGVRLPVYSKFLLGVKVSVGLLVSMPACDEQAACLAFTPTTLNPISDLKTSTLDRFKADWNKECTFCDVAMCSCATDALQHEMRQINTNTSCFSFFSARRRKPQIKLQAHQFPICDLTVCV